MAVGTFTAVARHHVILGGEVGVVPVSRVGLRHYVTSQPGPLEGVLSCKQGSYQSLVLTPQPQEKNVGN